MNTSMRPRVGLAVNGAAIPSNEIAVVIQSMFVPPAAPANVSAYINGTSALITWNHGDMSQDAVNYNYSAESDEGTRRVYIVDIIGGHCGSSPSPNFQDQTQATANAGTIGVWTPLPYLEAGYPITSDPVPQ